MLIFTRISASNVRYNPTKSFPKLAFLRNLTNPKAFPTFSKKLRTITINAGDPNQTLFQVLQSYTGIGVCQYFGFITKTFFRETEQTYKAKVYTLSQLSQDAKWKALK